MLEQEKKEVNSFEGGEQPDTEVAVEGADSVLAWLVLSWG